MKKMRLYVMMFAILMALCGCGSSVEGRNKNESDVENMTEDSKDEAAEESDKSIDLFAQKSKQEFDNPIELDGLVFYIPDYITEHSEDDGKYVYKTSDESCWIIYQDGELGENVNRKIFEDNSDKIEETMDGLMDDMVQDMMSGKLQSQELCGCWIYMKSYTGEFDGTAVDTIEVVGYNENLNRMFIIMFGCNEDDKDNKKRIEDFKNMIESATSSNDSSSVGSLSDQTPKKNDSSDIKGVDPDLKAFLDSYEEFVDEYVEFMKNYLNNPGDVLGMLGDYSDMLSKMEDFEKKVNSYDTKEMSTADAEYYIDVTARCTKKMLSVYE